MKISRILLVVLVTAALPTGAILLSCRGGEEPTDPKAKPPGVESLRQTIKKLQPLHQKPAKPRPGDWLDRFDEPGQSFSQYLDCNPVTPNKKRKTIAILPIGEFTKKQKQVLKLTAEFLRLYYCVPVKILKPLPAKHIPAQARRRHPQWGMKQFLSTYILDEILKPRLPKDALVLFGITATDLWPGEGWNFVYGQASLWERVGVQSIYRNGNAEGGPKEYQIFLQRTIKTATHEMGHVLSMQHCTAYECNMCGANHREESDRHPLWMCPQCLAKLCWACKADPLERYKKLAEFCRTHGLKTEAMFYEKSVKALGGTIDAGKNSPATKPTDTQPAPDPQKPSEKK